MAEYKASIEIAARDRFSTAAQKISGVSRKLSARLEEGQRALGQLGKKGAALKRLEALSTRLGSTGSEMDKVRRRTAELGRRIHETAKPTRKLQREFDKSRRISNALKLKHREQKDELNRLRRELRGAGVDTRRLRDEQSKVARAIERTTEKMEGLARVGDGVSRARERYDRSMRTAASAALVGDAVGRFGRGALSMVGRPLERMRAVERSAGEVATLGVSRQGIGLLKRRARRMAREVSGVGTAEFLSASYDLQSGISGLSEQGLAAMTAQAMLTARATKSEVGDMTDLFATAYGVFKGSLHEDLSDREFGGMFASMLAKSVQQFKTTGPKMQQAVESMGDGLAASGVKLSEQLAALGLLQQKMQAGVAGTTLQGIERTAAQAHEKFAKKGIDFKVLDERGNLRSLPDLLEDAQRAFGEQYTTQAGFQIQQAFGSEEAIKFFKALWGQQDAFRAAVQGLDEAGLSLDGFVTQMARLRDQNMDASLSKLEQRWSQLEEILGDALVPTLDRAMPWLEKIGGWFEWFTEKMPGTTSTLVTLVGGFGLIATIVAPVITAVTSLALAVHFLGYRAKKAAAEISLGRGGGLFSRGLGRGRGIGGKVGRAGSVIKDKAAPWLSKLKFLKGKGGVVGAVLGAGLTGKALLDSDLSRAEKAKEAGGWAGATGGGLLGAKLGAMGGTLVFPGVGTVVGGALGGILGGMGGLVLGEDLGRLIGGGESSAPDGSASATGGDSGLARSIKHAGAAAAAGIALSVPANAVGVGASPQSAVIPAVQVLPAVGQKPASEVRQGSTVVTKNYGHNRITIHQEPGEDPQALVDRLLRELEQRQDQGRREELYDEVGD